MNSHQMKNIIVLKDLPSNLVEEAFIILKSNKKIRSVELADKKSKEQPQKENSKEYIVKEAEMVISNYLSKIEKEKTFRSYSMKKIENKYKMLRKVTTILGIILIINLILEIIGL